MIRIALTAAALLLGSTAAWAGPKTVTPLDAGWQVRIDPADAAATTSSNRDRSSSTARGEARPG